MVVDPLGLRVSLRHQPTLVSFSYTILIVINLEDPLATDDLSPRGRFGKRPSVVLQQRFISSCAACNHLFASGRFLASLMVFGSHRAEAITSSAMFSCSSTPYRMTCFRSRMGLECSAHALFPSPVVRPPLQGLLCLAGTSTGTSTGTSAGWLARLPLLLNGWCIVSSFGWFFFGQAKVVLIKRHVSSIEHSIAAFLHQLVPSVSLEVPKETHLFSSVVELLRLGRRDQGVGNTAKHSQVAEIWFSAVPNFTGALALQGGRLVGGCTRSRQ